MRNAPFFPLSSRHKMTRPIGYCRRRFLSPIEACFPYNRRQESPPTGHTVEQLNLLRRPNTFSDGHRAREKKRKRTSFRLPAYRVSVHRGLSQFSRRQLRCLRKTLSRRENGTVPLAPREGDRSLFSEDVLLTKHVFPPKNGPVPNRPVNGYPIDLCATTRATPWGEGPFQNAIRSNGPSSGNPFSILVQCSSLRNKWNSPCGWL